ncbi:hypothetical protein GMMP15_1490004 [Candidatus Magnetomoraceae bacterium gMMP-15]
MIMKNYKLLLVVIMFVSLFCNINTGFCETVSFYRINPVYSHLFKDKPFVFQKSSRQSRSSFECHSYEELKSGMKENFEHRVTEFTIDMTYNFLSSEVETILNQAVDEIMAEDDYLRFSLIRYKFDASGTDGDVTITGIIEYFTTYEQEEQVSQRTSEILEQIITNDMNDEEKEKAIHDWIAKNVEYDQSLEEYSAYAALFGNKETVCQGYALLAFKMLKDSGINVKIIDGEAFSNNEEVNHAWNMVYLCGNWYHLDITWDDPVFPVPNPDYVRYDYFNKSDSEMSGDHSWEADNFPQASVSYVEGVCVNSCTISGKIITNLTGYETGIKNALISLNGNSNYQSTTAQDGIFTISDVDKNSYNITISATNFITHTAEMNLSGDLNIGEIELIPTTTGYTQEELDNAVQTAVSRYDINHNDQIDLQEVIYYLQVLSGIR